ncbi:hypothetical protein ABIC63_000505 [Pseudacidovorax sp. 1753]|uniref:hypothetical protein n=1 Tax=Pseudacidovorax sp. 1753 TaxID=3156419 RepID=UPI00339622C4
MAVTYNGSSVAAAFTAGVINDMWKEAADKYAEVSTWANTAIGMGQSVPTVQTAAVPDLALPEVPTISLDDASDQEALYSSSKEEILAMMRDSFGSIISTYFPRFALYDEMLDWCDRAVRDGGSGIKVAVEVALWERDRSRIAAEMLRAEEESVASWADRGFPLPSGPLAAQVQQVRLAAAGQLAAQSRDIAIKQFEAELENVRFAVRTVIDQRQAAMDSALRYMTALAQAPDIAVRLATGLADLRTRGAQALVAFYSAQVAALDPRIRLALGNAELAAKVGQANQSAVLTSIEEKVKAALAALQAAASMASAGINAINAQASYSGQDD